MINRLVKMTFRPDAVDHFLEVFSQHNSSIRQVEGCHHLELWQDENDPNTFFTFSRWGTTADLENYRQSDLFRAIWGTVKPGFAAKPEAWTVAEKVF